MHQDNKCYLVHENKHNATLDYICMYICMYMCVYVGTVYVYVCTFWSIFLFFQNHNTLSGSILILWCLILTEYVIIAYMWLLPIFWELMSLATFHSLKDFFLPLILQYIFVCFFFVCELGINIFDDASCSQRFFPLIFQIHICMLFYLWAGN